MSDPINELDVVALEQVPPGESLSAGQVGTVVYVHENGQAFEVEFIVEPRRSVVVTVRREYILKLKGLGYSRAAG